MRCETACPKGVQVLGCELGCRVGHEVSVGNVGETRKQRERSVEGVEPVDRDEEVARRSKMARTRSVEPGGEACCAGGTGLPCRKSRRDQEEGLQESPDGDVAVEKGRRGLKGVDSEDHEDGQVPETR